MDSKATQWCNMHVILCLCSLLAANSQFSIPIGQKMQLTGWDNANNMRMRHARTHKLQISGPTVYSLYCVPLPWLVAGTISAVSRTAFTFVDEKFESPIALHSPFFTSSSIACKDFINLLSTNKQGGSIFPSLVWFFLTFLSKPEMRKLQQVCSKSSLPCSHQAVRIRMRSHRLLRLDDNKSAASCQQAGSIEVKAPLCIGWFIFK